MRASEPAIDAAPLLCLKGSSAQVVGGVCNRKELVREKCDTDPSRNFKTGFQYIGLQSRLLLLASLFFSIRTLEPTKNKCYRRPVLVAQKPKCLYDPFT